MWEEIREKRKNSMTTNLDGTERRVTICARFKASGILYLGGDISSQWINNGNADKACGLITHITSSVEKASDESGVTNSASLPSLDTKLPKTPTLLDLLSMWVCTHVYATGWENAVGSLQVKLGNSSQLLYTKSFPKIDAKWVPQQPETQPSISAWWTSPKSHIWESRSFK